MTPARLHPLTLRAAWWTARSLRRARRDLQRRPYTEVRISAPPPLPAQAARGVTAVLRRTSPTCLERALVLQRWLASHGSARDVVIGVTSSADGFAAHAWLDGEEHGGEYAELTRLSA
jgi:transglutaminase superfamily protein